MHVYKAENLIEKGKSVHVFKSKTHGVVTHTHDFIEIVYILSGKGVQTVDGKTYDVRRGDMLFINYGSVHGFVLEENSSYINICFSPETVGENIITSSNAFSILSLTAFNELRCEEGGGRITFSGKERGEVEDVLAAMLREYKEKKYAWDTVVGNYLNVLITYMLRKTEVGVEASETDETWQALAEYIDENLQSRLTLSALAGKCFYNPSYFSRVFKEKFGMSLVEYITRKRLAYAVKLLSEGELSVDEISEAAGFSDRSGFYHAFSKYIGGSPSDFRPESKVKKSHKKER